MHINWRKPIINLLLKTSGSKVMDHLETIKWLDSQPYSVVKRYQDQKLKKLLFHAYKNVPYYQLLLPKVGVIDECGRVNLARFSSVPPLTKDIIRKAGSALYSRDHKKRGSYENTSGGSTGEPVRFLQDRDYSDWNIANKIFYKTFVNQSIGDKELRLWGSEKDLLAENEPFSLKLKNYLYNRHELNAFRMNPKRMSEYVKRINVLQPRWIESYVQPMYELAQFIEKNNISVHTPKGVLTSAGTLYPEMREKIESVFKTKVFNRYGSREVGDAACSCSEESMHISMWNNRIDFKKHNRNQPQNALKSILVTNLNNYSMPFIKYEIGDIASEVIHSKCKCGRKSDLLVDLQGREMSVFKKKDGSVIPAEFFIHFIGVVYNSGSIRKFQAIQEKYDKIVIKVIIENESAFMQDIPHIESAIRLAMGDTTKIVWKQVSNIEPLPSGKYLYTVSKV
jgi:phenylacetate-CoA ligase